MECPLLLGNEHFHVVQIDSTYGLEGMDIAIIYVIIFACILLMMGGYACWEKMSMEGFQSVNHICRTIYTSWNDASPWWATNYLDRHHPLCNVGERMSDLKLEARSSPKQIRYRAKCCRTEYPPNNTVEVTYTNEPVQYTQWDETGGWNSIYLDRHNIECGNNFLRGAAFQSRYNPNRQRFAYNCTGTRVNGGQLQRQCSDHYTSLAPEGYGTNYLASHRIACTDGQGIARIRLVRDGRGNYRYHYRCCAESVRPNDDCAR